MVNGLIFLLLFWNATLSSLGELVGVFFGGFLIGLEKGQKKLHKMAKYLEYQAVLKNEADKEKK
jgi:hypothetical protein